MSQIINTSETSPIDFDSLRGPKGNKKAKVVDAYNMFNVVPKPDVSLYDWYTFDNVDIDPTHNNGNDNIDAGETIHIGTELLNRGGMAKDVVGKIDVSRLSSDIVDPYVTIVTDTVNYSDIGTYSIRDAEKVMNSDTIVDVKKPFVIKVAENTPNNYKCDINIHITWKNGLDPNDTNTYSYDSVMTLDFHRGVYLPSRIDEDTTLTADKLWIVADTVRIGEGVTVNVDPGTTIQFCTQNQSVFKYATPKIQLTDNSSFICKGTTEEMIVLDVYQKKYRAFFELSSLANIEFSYCDIFGIDVLTTQSTKNSYFLNHCIYRKNYNNNYIIKGEEDSFLGNKYYDFPLSSVNSCLFYSPFFRTADEVKNMCYVGFDLDIGCPEKLLNNTFFIDTLHKSRINLYSTNVQYLISGNFFINSGNRLQTLYECPMISLNYDENDYQDGIRIQNNTFYGYPNVLSEKFVDSSKFKNEMTGTASIEDAWPFVSGYQFTNDKGEETTKFSKENMNLKLIFNRAMDTTQDLSVTFGSVEPYGDYKINGSWTDSSTWVGKCEIPTAIENGTQHLRITGGRADSDHFLTNEDNGYRITFDIDTTSAMSMNMNATPSEDGILLRMNQDDYSTIMGYNVYRSEQADGEYARINTAVIRPDSDDEQTASYLDKTVEPGKTYYYSYTAVMTDFSESKASGRTSATALDTINPIIAHTPVNQGYLGSNLNINCTITDNVRVTYANLYYRVKGEEEYKVVSMTHSNNKYSGFIPAADLSLDGMQYYIETSDGTNVVTVGSKDSPYTVVIKESSAVSYLGDVDGNGVIEAVDAMLVLQHINGKRVLVNEEFSRADLDGNKKLETFEALAILQYINGSRTNLDIEA